MSDQPDPPTAAPPSESPALRAELRHLAALVSDAERRAAERSVRRRLAAQLREAAADPDGVDPLAAHIWTTCPQDPDQLAIWADPRTIAAAAYRWLADHLEGDTP